MEAVLNLDDDVAALLARVREERQVSLDELANEVLRNGLQTLAQRSLYRTRTFDAGSCLVGSLDNVAEVLAIAEGEDYR